MRCGLAGAIPGPPQGPGPIQVRPSYGGNFTIGDGEIVSIECTPAPVPREGSSMFAMHPTKYYERFGYAGGTSRDLGKRYGIKPRPREVEAADCRRVRR